MYSRDYIGSTSFFWSPEHGITIKSLHLTLAEKYAVHLSVERQILEHLGQHPRIVQYGNQGKTSPTFVISNMIRYLGFHESSPEGPEGLRLAEANNGTLQAYLNDFGSVMEEVTRISLSLQVIEAVEFIHRRNVIHSDLHPDNCLLQRNGSTLNLLLCDFGGSVCRDLHLDGLGLPDAPFWNLSWETSINTDIFAAGSVIYSIMTGSWPFGVKSETETKDEYEDRVNSLIEQDLFPETGSIAGGTVISACWTRPDCTAEDILNLSKSRNANYDWNSIKGHCRGCDLPRPQ